MATRIASTSEGGLGAGRSKEPGREGSWAMVQPGIPPVFDRNERWEHEAWGEHYKVNDEIYNALTLALDLHRERSLQVSDVSYYRTTCSFLVAFLWFLLTFPCLQQLKQMSRDKSDELAHQYTRVHWLEQDNTHLLAQIGEVNALVSDLEERDCKREEELAQARRERDAQRAAAEQKAQEVEAQAAKLRWNAAALEQKNKAVEAKEAELQRMEAELQGKEAAVTMLTEAHVQKDVILEA